eukprot:m.4305 g.4305  ORF g.4305 m.4305 type:complete len:405 (+) comp10519_c0_seq1:37-1251(+)
MEAKESLLRSWLSRFEGELEAGMAFWLKNSHDKEFGGFYNCLTRDGKVYDDTKYGWLQCRQVWMYCKLYRETAQYQSEEVRSAAIAGGEFVLKHIYRPSNHRCYFQVTREGLPIYMQRKPFTEVFFILAMTELCRVTRETRYQEVADKVLAKFRYWAREDDSELGRLHLAGEPKCNGLGVPMMFLCVLQEICLDDKKQLEKHRDDFQWCVQQILPHVKKDKKAVLENVSVEGNMLPGSKGRLMNPGHAIEAGWFLLRYASLVNDDRLKDIAISDFILLPFEVAWDSDKHGGGLLYFLDVEGFPQTALEASMKLWWPHCEAIIGLLMAYDEQKEDSILQNFKKVFDYSLKHFGDPEYGEWFGYLNRDGSPLDDNPFKGGPYKSCFHTLRCFHMAVQIIRKILNSE